MKLISLPMTTDTRLTLVNEGAGWVFSSWYGMKPGISPAPPTAEHRQRTFPEPEMAVEFFLTHYATNWGRLQSGPAKKSR